MTTSTSSSCPPSVLVLGAGELGIEIIKSLAQHPLRRSNDIDLAVLLRPSSINSDSPAKQAEIKAIKELGFRLVPGDVINDSLQDLSRIFKDFHTVISCTGMTFPPGTQVKITKAVLGAGCARYFPWQFGVDYDIIGRESSQDLFTEQLDVRDLLRGQSETQWVRRAVEQPFYRVFLKQNLSFLGHRLDWDVHLLPLPSRIRHRQRRPDHRDCPRQLG